ncbi:MAG: hypothetical protein H7840_06385 [Alphaproteobacteria bacterium]
MTTRPSTRATVTVLMLLVGCLVGRPGAAAPAAEAPLRGNGPTIVLETEAESPSLWESAKGVMGAIGSALVPPTPGDFARSLTGRESSEFWKLLEDAGYKLKEVETSVGIIPGLSATFKLVRELSESDREWLERQMDLHARKDGSVVARMQRSILNVLLEASEMGNFKIEKLEVDLLPLPKARFVLSPSVNVLSEDHDALYRMLESVKRKLH